MAYVVARMGVRNNHGGMMNGVRAAVSALLACLCAAGLTGCDTDTGPAPTGTTQNVTASPTPADSSTPAPAVPPSPGPQTYPIDRDNVTTGGSLGIAVQEFPSSWNPWNTSVFALDPVRDAMTPRLFSMAPDGTLHWDSIWLLSEPQVLDGDLTSTDTPDSTGAVTGNTASTPEGTEAEASSSTPEGTGGNTPMSTGSTPEGTKGDTSGSTSEGTDGKTPGTTEATSGNTADSTGATGSATGNTQGSTAGMTVRYELSPRAVWSDQVPITADDFLATWQACAEDPGPVCTGRGFEHVTGITAGESQSTVLVSYDSDYAGWPYTFLRGPSRASTVDSPQARDEVWDTLMGRQAAFSGPFTVASDTSHLAQAQTAQAQSQGGSVVLTRNPVWWGPYPKLDTIEVSLASNDDPVLSYLREDIDGIWVNDPKVYSRLSVLDGIETRRSLGRQDRFLVMNCASGPLADKDIRRAVLLGLDRNKLSASDLAGWKWSGTLNSPVWISAQQGYVDLTQDDKEVGDIKAAKTLLDSAGWAEGEDGIRFKAGAPLEWDYLVPRDDSFAENEGYGLRVALADVGIRLDLRYVDPAEVDLLMETKDFGMAGATMAYSTPLEAAGRYGAGNPWGYSSAQVNALFARASATLDPDQGAELLNDIADLVWQDAPVIPLYETPEILLVRTGVANYGPNELGTIMWENVGWVG